MEKVIVLYNWRVYDPVRGRHFTTRHKATAAQIRQTHPEATPIESSREERIVDDDRPPLSTNDFMGRK